MSHIKSLPFVDESSHAHALDRTDAGELIDPDTYNPQSHLSLPTKSETQTSFHHFRANPLRHRLELPRVFTAEVFREVLMKVAVKNDLIVEMMESGRCLLSKKRSGIWKDLLNCCWSRSEIETFIAAEVKKDTLNKRSHLNLKLLEGSRREFQEFTKSLSLIIQDSHKNTSIEESVIYEEKSPDSMVETAVNLHSPILSQIHCYSQISENIKKHYHPELTKFNEEFNQVSKKLRENPSLDPILLIHCLLTTLNHLYSELCPQYLALFDKDLIYYSIEKHLCQYANPILTQIYTLRESPKEELFQLKKSLLFSNTPSQCMTFLDIKPRYRLLSESIPYHSSIALLSQLNHSISLRERLSTIQKYYSQIKINCYEFHKGKEEISTMDDILPVMIYTVLKSEVRGFYGLVSMLRDYAKAMDRFETDLRILTNLFVALQYIAKDWKVD